jgi:hypothetical protein
MTVRARFWANRMSPGYMRHGVLGCANPCLRTDFTSQNLTMGKQPTPSFVHVHAQDCQGRSSQPRSQAGKKSLRMLCVLSLRKPGADAGDEVVAGVALAAARCRRGVGGGAGKPFFSRCLQSLRHPKVTRSSPAQSTMPTSHDQGRASSSEWHPATLCLAGAQHGS